MKYLNSIWLSIWHFIKRHKIISAIIVLIIILIGYFILKNTKKPEIQYVEVAKGSITEKVSVTGRVSPVDKADLSFEKSGVVQSINVKLGDIVNKGKLLASLNNSDTEAQYASAIAKLEELQRGLRPEESAVERARIETARVALANAYNEALIVSRDAQIKSQTALVNYLDILFTNPQSANPTIKIPTPSNTVENSLNFRRIEVTDIMNRWQTDLQNYRSTSTAMILLNNSLIYLEKVKELMTSIYPIVNDLNPSGSGISQVTIDQYISNMNSALSIVNQAISSVQNTLSGIQKAELAYSEAQSSYLLKNSGSSPENIKSQQATADSLLASINKGRIFSPIDGRVVRIVPSVGDFVSPGQTMFSILGEGGFKIEAYVPEADIAKVKIGDMSSTTLDAYGQHVDFPAKVVSIEQAETIKDGVPTYKVTLYFIKIDPRIISGMTANLEIVTNLKENALVLPTRAVRDQAGQRTVNVLQADGKTSTPVNVKTGIRGYDGTIEIIDGVNEGDRVVTSVK